MVGRPSKLVKTAGQKSDAVVPVRTVPVDTRGTVLGATIGTEKHLIVPKTSEMTAE